MKSSAQPELLRRMNVRRILEVLRTHGPCSRADLTRISGISAPTVSKVTASLLDSGLLEEGGARRPRVGRPGRLLRLAGERARVLGIALDVPHCHVAAAGFDGRFEASAVGRVLVPDRYETLIDRLAEWASPHVEDPQSHFLGIGVSVPGLIDSQEQKVILSANIGITNGRRVAEDLGRRLGVTCVLLQEANAHCLAERMFGAAADLDDFALMDVTTGLGVGFMVHGELFAGSRGFAGELGHVLVDSSDGARRCGCGKTGCLETIATDRALCHGIEQAIGRAVTIDEALELVRDGDPAARAELDRVSEALARALSIVIDVFDPGAVFVHGRFLDARPDLFEDVCERARELALDPAARGCDLRRASVTKIHGALAAILRHLTTAQGPRVR